MENRNTHRELRVTKYFGELYDTNVHAIIPKNMSHLSKLWDFCFSKEFNGIERKYDTKIGVTNSVFEKVPFNKDGPYTPLPNYIDYNLINPFSNDPTQWLFHGHPVKADNPLQVAFARLIGYRWPAETDKEMQLSDEARQLIEDVKKFDDLSDNDGIICIPSVNAEETAADRLRNYLKEVFGKEWNNNTHSSPSDN